MNMKRSILIHAIVCAVLLLGVTTHNLAVDLPLTSAGKRSQQILNFLNGKIKIESKEFVRQNCSENFKKNIPEAQWGGLLAQLKNMSSSVELIKVIKSEEYKIVFVIQLTSNKMYLTVTVQVEEQSPNLISSMMFVPGGNDLIETSPKTQIQNKSIGEPDSVSIQGIKNYLNELAKQNKFSGSALIAKDGKILLHETTGYANKKFKVLNKHDTKFNLASIGKSFTSVAVLQLIEAGKLNIDDPIGKYLVYFPKEVGEKVTIRHLLNMSSGWSDYWDNEYYLAHRNQLRKVSDYMEFIKDMPLGFEPGTNTIHSNTGFEVAGAIIEKVSGMDYFDYLKEKIFQPAGMTNTDAYHRDGPVENMAVGYTNMNRNDKAGTGYDWENTYMLPPRGTPAGGSYSTNEDMLKYDIALREGKLLGKDYLNFASNAYQGKIGDPYVQKRLSRMAGGAPGVSTFLASDVNNGFTIIVFTNYDHPAGINIGNEIIKRLGLE
jgi:CubicO group peptidase (beta-lactamase class C family)